MSYSAASTDWSTGVVSCNCHDVTRPGRHATSAVGVAWAASAGRLASGPDASPASGEPRRLWTMPPEVLATATTAEDANATSATASSKITYGKCSTDDRMVLRT